jgi:RNA polymerase sigma-70 factor, ECF subfamily
MMGEARSRGHHVTEAEFADSYREHYRRIYRYCLFRTASPYDAEEVAAEAFARLLSRRTPLPADAALPWLFRVAKNLCVDYARRQDRVRPSAPDTFPEPPAPEVWQPVETWDSVRALRPDEQLLVYLRVIEDLPFPQVAALVGRSEGAVKMAFHRGMKKLARTLSEGARDDAATVTR